MIKIFSLDLDSRLKAFCANARVTYEWYLNVTAGSEDNLSIQRKIIAGSKAYSTLRADLKRGCVLPPIVLAAHPRYPLVDILDPNRDLSEEEEVSALPQVLSWVSGLNSAEVYIVDGLQRTNALRQVREELTDGELEKFLKSHLRVEIWLNISFAALAYRMLLLNAGQKPMSIKLQVEILSQNLKQDLQGIPRIEIIDLGRRRVHSGQFQLSKLSQAFQAWLQGSPNVDIRNVVVEQMLADAALETLSAAMNPTTMHASGQRFRDFVEWLVEIDYLIGQDNLEFLGNETVLQGIASAIGSCQRDDNLRDRVDGCLQNLKGQLITQQASDPFGIAVFEGMRKGIDSSRRNVGEATRNLVFHAFQEHFVTSGMRNMSDCWTFAGARH